MRTISDPYGSLETLEESPEDQRDAGQFGIPPILENATKRPIYLNGNTPSSALLLKNPKGQGV